ncbi:TolC family protein [Erythrobacter sp. HA6-11]
MLPDDVLKSSAQWAPAILASVEREAAARGDQITAAGAFDLVFKADAFSRVTGFWSGSVLEAEARQPLAGLAGEIYAGYRISDGRFPIYEDEYFTNSLGEFKLGALFSLLRDREVDDRRFAIEDTRLAVDQAGLDVLLTQLGVQHEALKVYWRWVTAGRELAIYEDLLDIAQTREAGLTRQVARGAMPEIAVVENRQNILLRRRLVTEAERRMVTAENNLSLFLRDESGQMTPANRDQLPQAAEVPAQSGFGQIVETPLSQLIEQRPDLARLGLGIERARNEVALRQNDLQSRLDFNVELSRDIGSIAEGGRSRDSTDTVVGLRFTVPLQRRAAKGRIQRAEAELREAEFREQQVSEQITLEIKNILVDLEAALLLSRLASEEVEQSELMVQAEQRRFALGAGDFFLVNLREQSAADARIRSVRAELAARLAEAGFNAATVNLERLGLSPD